MNALTKALLAICLACPITGFIASEKFQADRSHSIAVGYTPQQRAGIDTLLDKPDDILARGRRNALARVKHPMTPREAREAMRLLYAEAR